MSITRLASLRLVLPRCALVTGRSTVRCLSTTNYETLLVEAVGEKKNVGLIRLNRPKALNALNSTLMGELGDCIADMNGDPNIGCIVITGSEKSFAAGADIKEMADKTFVDCYKKGFLENWSRVAKSQKPTIAAVNGYALGGGSEVAMMCDIIYAGENAVFGQPEILLGTLPGAGGTQRLTHAIGKSRAMEICLSGKQYTAQEADKWGLVSRVFPVDQVNSPWLHLQFQTTFVATKTISKSGLEFFTQTSVNARFCPIAASAGEHQTGGENRFDVPSERGHLQGSSKSCV